MSKRVKDPAVYLWDMLYEIDWIAASLHRKEQIYDSILGRALLRSFTVLGEAAKRVDDATKIRSSHIPWQKVIDTRNFLSHEYENVNLERIWDIVDGHLPQLKTDLLLLYKELTGTDYHAD